MNQLLQLVGEDKAASVMAKVSKCREGDDVLIWKPNSQGTFFSKSAWDMIRVWQPQTCWGRWVWHSTLLKKMSVIMWKAFSKALSVDSRVRQMGVALASRCDCCLTGNEETPNHVLSTGEVANEVWRKVSVALGIRWRSKQNWYDRVNSWWAIAGKKSQVGYLQGLLPTILTRRLWMRRCKARMEGVHETVEQIFRSIKFWLQHVSSNLKNVKI
ncbi:uncharacterized protein LOC111387497 [Olea europaea var. sylvestris]|uniref:uncharacterized protein LOC111387497 n=1 Tax=Olea europaea var. sylvestris TaxID=158386 RepID=UPI000C1CE710|nr:uncharacterized protein LOC111387497 [Olea europaea var. sylvestris]